MQKVVGECWVPSQNRMASVTLTIRTGEYEKTETGWKVKVVGHAAEDGKYDFEGCSLALVVNGTEQEIDDEEVARTSVHGFLEYDANLPGPGKHFVLLKIRTGLGEPGLHVGEYVTVKPTEAPKPKAPKELRVKILGSRGNYKLHLSVTDDEGKYIPLAKVYLAFNDRDAWVFTDEDGVFPWRVPREDCWIHIQAGSPDELRWDGFLRGPEPEQVLWAEEEIIIY